MELWKDHSNSQIATIIGAKSRCAVSGMANRMGLKKPKPPKKETQCRNRGKLTEAEKALRRRPKTMAEIIKGESIPPLLDSILELREDKCAYPYGATAFKFCGRPRERGCFCEMHAQLCYNAPKLRSDIRPFFRTRANGR